VQVKGIIWVGTPTDAREQLATFFHDLLGMSVATDAVGFTRLSTANGDRIEIFGPESSEYVQLDTGPVAGFWVDDAHAARRELIAAGVDSCTALEFGADGHAWFYFRAPDGNFYELCEHNRFLERPAS
jgi:catechol 2,3-dioxygenase-like lactoylglutathione lyase family enzyme